MAAAVDKERERLRSIHYSLLDDDQQEVYDSEPEPVAPPDDHPESSAHGRPIRARKQATRYEPTLLVAAGCCKSVTAADLLRADVNVAFEGTHDMNVFMFS